MQKIWITGSPGSGKTTMANILGSRFDIPVFYNDRIFFEENWKVRPEKEQIKITKKIMNNNKWIYEGNRFTTSKDDGRYNCCDTIIYLKFNRFVCLYRAIKRYFKYRGTVRPEISDGCFEEIDLDFVKYILIGYPNKEYQRQKLFCEAKKAGKIIIVLNGKKAVKKWIKTLEV